MTLRTTATILLASFSLLGHASAELPSTDGTRSDRFRQLEELLPTPTSLRTASGAPGPDYWQQQVDYEIDVELDDERRRIRGIEKITYHNRSPHPLPYLWLQLEPNIFTPDSDAVLTATAPQTDKLEIGTLRSMIERRRFDGGVRITYVQDAEGSDLTFTIVKTMLRIDLPEPVLPGESTKFVIAWNYAINDAKTLGGRTGYEFFEEDGNCIYEMAQWFPRLAAYTDVTGWQHKQFLGSGEFTLEFGSYLVRITVPDDHVVAATGTLENPEEALRPEWRKRLEQAQGADAPVFVITPEEAKWNQSTRSSSKKTWIFRADNVRDFAFASSRKFIWDAMTRDIGDRSVLCMSFYPNEGEPLWSQYSTRTIAHTLDVYSKFAFPYPYPVAISVNGPVFGMEYPMICFNGPRPEKDGTYSKSTKYALITVIIHEVGHNWFPMIVNSDERQWTWMDEGLNTFLQYLAEQEWEEEYPSRRGEPKDIVGYMSSERQVPIMTNSESILQFGNNAYAKPATALNVLRETVLGRELFDHAFRIYSERWKFKRPMPADFFRTMEDASGIDLDWFWRSWFYSTDAVDIDLVDLKTYVLETGDPDIDKPRKKQEREDEPATRSRQRNADLPKAVDRIAELRDFYDDYDELDVTDEDRREFRKFLDRLSESEKEALRTTLRFHVARFRNVGGLVSPIPLRIEFEDGSSDEFTIPAEIWRRNHREVSKLFITEKPIRSIEVDPHLETADIDRDNNHFPRKPIRSRFEIFKKKKSKNPMQPENEDEDQDEQDDGDDA